MLHVGVMPQCRDQISDLPGVNQCHRIDFVTLRFFPADGAVVQRDATVVQQRLVNHIQHPGCDLWHLHRWAVLDHRHPLAPARQRHIKGFQRGLRIVQAWLQTGPGAGRQQWLQITRQQFQFQRFGRGQPRRHQIRRTGLPEPSHRPRALIATDRETRRQLVQIALDTAPVDIEPGCMQLLMHLARRDLARMARDDPQSFQMAQRGIGHGGKKLWMAGRLAARMHYDTCCRARATRPLQNRCN